MSHLIVRNIFNLYHNQAHCLSEEWPPPRLISRNQPLKTVWFKILSPSLTWQYVGKDCFELILSVSKYTDLWMMCCYCYIFMFWFYALSIGFLSMKNKSLLFFPFSHQHFHIYHPHLLWLNVVMLVLIKLWLYAIYKWDVVNHNFFSSETHFAFSWSELLPSPCPLVVFLSVTQPQIFQQDLKSPLKRCVHTRYSISFILLGKALPEPSDLPCLNCWPIMLAALHSSWGFYMLCYHVASSNSNTTSVFE